MANPTIYLEIDASELDAEIIRLQAVMKPERFNQVMFNIFQRTVGHVRKILQQDLPKEYHVTPARIGKAVKSPKMTSGMGGVGCTIPIRDTRGSIGGMYTASGGARGWDSVRKKYRVKARIVKSSVSTLPENMDSYGGMKPFRNLGPRLKIKLSNEQWKELGGRPKSKLSGLTFTRAGKPRGPILKVSGIAIPQMPMNRSQEDVQRDILDYMKARIEHEFQRVIAGGR